MIHFTHPIALFLLLPIIPIAFIFFRSNSTEKIPFLIRILVITFLIFALAGIGKRSKSNSLVIALLIDVSDSVPISERQTTEKLITEIEKKFRPHDTLRVIYFADRATLGDRSDKNLDRSVTNFVSAIQLAISTFRNENQKRIVIATDGNENDQKIADLYELLKANEIEIFTFPIGDSHLPELIVHDLDLPSKVRIGERFEIKAFVESSVATNAEIVFYRNDYPIITKQKKIAEGGQYLNFADQISENGVHNYRLEIFVSDPNADTVFENNTSLGITQTETEKPQILIIADQSRSTQFLAQILDRNHFSIETISPSEFSSDHLQTTNVIALIDLPASAFSDDQLQMLKSFVRDVGSGLIAIGCRRSFGLGGYRETPLEEILPVRMTPKQKKEPIALIMLIDASGSMADYVGADQKMSLAIESVRSAIRALSKDDLVGVIGFGAEIKLEIPPTIDHDFVLRKVGRLRSSSGTKMLPALKRAHDLIRKTDAKQKQLIILSDGRSDGDFEQISQQIAKNQIGVATISIGKSATALLQKIATLTNGRHTHVRNIAELPKIMIGEVQQTQKLYVEGEFFPKIASENEIFRGIDFLPQIDNYVSTSVKSSAKQIAIVDDRPLIAVWNYGLGRSIAFTSEIENWIEWENLGKFWTQAIGSLISQSNGEIELDLNRKNNEIEITVDGVSTSPDIRIAQPNFDGKVIEMKQVSQNRFRAIVPIENHGVFLATAIADGKSVTKPIVISYPIEFAKLGVDQRKLNEIAKKTHGVFQPTISQILDQPNSKPIRKFSEWHQPILIFALFLFLIELVLRKFKFRRSIEKTEIEKNEDLISDQPKTISKLQLDRLLAAKRR